MLKKFFTLQIASLLVIIGVVFIVFFAPIDVRKMKGAIPNGPIAQKISLYVQSIFSYQKEVIRQPTGLSQDSEGESKSGRSDASLSYHATSSKFHFFRTAY